MFTFRATLGRSDLCAMTVHIHNRQRLLSDPDVDASVVSNFTHRHVFPHVISANSAKTFLCDHSLALTKTWMLFLSNMRDFALRMASSYGWLVSSRPAELLQTVIPDQHSARSLVTSYFVPALPPKFVKKWGKSQTFDIYLSSLLWLKLLTEDLSTVLICKVAFVPI